MNLDRIREACVDAALASGKVLRGAFGRGKLDIQEKKGAGLVTNVDIEAERVALEVLTKAFPDFGIIAEESPRVDTSSPGRWILDPLDGTTNFIHGFPMFCTSIAAQWGKQVVVGVIHHPVLDETYIAVRGQGATLNGGKLTVSGTARLTDALLTTGFSYDRGAELHQDVTTFERLSNVARAIRRPGSAALDLAYTARGVFDGFWERNLAAWDVAAGALLVEEAGGKATDYSGNAFDPLAGEIIVGNPVIHGHLLQVISPDYCKI